MRQTRLAVVVLIPFLLSEAAHAIELVDWKVSAGPPMATFSDVAIVSGTRVFSGFEEDPVTLAISATVFTAIGDPGTVPMVATDLGLSFFSSAGTSLASDGGGGYRLTAVQAQIGFELRSLIYDSIDLGNPVPVFGPGPEFNPDVNLSAINRTGLAAGDLAAVVPLVATPSGVSSLIDILVPAQLTSVDSTGTLFGGFSEPAPGGAQVATIVTSTGSVLLQGVLDGSVEDLEGVYAVGARNGLAAYWRAQGESYVGLHVLDGNGVPLAGNLLAIDHTGKAIAAGFLADGRAILVDLVTGDWLDVGAQLPIPPGTLLEIVGIDFNGDQMVLAANSVSLEGYDITATILPRPVPGPGLFVIPSLLIVGMRMVRRQR